VRTNAKQKDKKARMSSEYMAAKTEARISIAFQL
jgi:hypothetical protein